MKKLILALCLFSAGCCSEVLELTPGRWDVNGKPVEANLVIIKQMDDYIYCADYYYVGKLNARFCGRYPDVTSFREDSVEIGR